MSGSPKLGPVITGSLLTRNLAGAVDAYCTFMHAQILRQGKVSQSQSEYWQTPHLKGNPYAILTNALGEPWLRIIEDKDCKIQDPLKHTGWMALEVLVEDVDTLAHSLESSPFKILRPVANLDVSDKIRAVQVKGPCGEILYLTQVNGEVPPFQLPQAKCPVDHVFIPILCTHDRDSSLQFYENLADTDGLKFETKITVLNQAYGYELEKKHPVATLQLKNNTLIEIDQIEAALPLGKHLISGIFMISFRIDTLPKSEAENVKDCPLTGQRAMLIKGPNGELTELIEPAK